MKIRVGILTAPKIEVERRKDTFLLKNVRIGIGFHWDRLENQEFAGILEIIESQQPTANSQQPLYTAVNTLDLEDYLCSVISSEMRADSPMELLKAHAVISRSWAIRAIEANSSQPSAFRSQKSAFRIQPITHVSNGHVGFDVCADDHCQRYEGLRRMNERAIEAVRATRGQVLINGEWLAVSGERQICDCRYHKCCGGRTEEWRTCWEDKDVAYIQSVECPYCGRISDRTLRLVLNDYDQETRDFHDWHVRYTARELGDIIRRKSGIDFGDVVDLVPLKRGPSGRIYELEIIGTNHRQTIGKELRIRQWLSETCLYSSWFEVEKTVNSQFSIFNLKGHGWGHGAGLCQIGAAQMATEGFTYEQILAHYYPNTQLQIED